MEVRSTTVQVLVAQLLTGMVEAALHKKTLVVNFLIFLIKGLMINRLRIPLEDFKDTRSISYSM